MRLDQHVRKAIRDDVNASEFDSALLNACIAIDATSTGDVARDRRRGDRMIQSHSTGHPAASSVPRWLAICLQWLLFQQMHYHGSESRVMPLRGIELF
jgi:hypothetical protein